VKQKLETPAPSGLRLESEALLLLLVAGWALAITFVALAQRLALFFGG
jgi:hypothetical protein